MSPNASALGRCQLDSPAPSEGAILMSALSSIQTFKIRPLTAADARAWWDLRFEALERDPEAFSASLEDHRNLTLDDVRARICSDPVNNFVLGAFAEDNSSAQPASSASAARRSVTKEEFGVCM